VPSGAFTAREIAAVAGFLDSLAHYREELELEFDESSGALLWRGGVLEPAGPGFYHALKKITGTST
jgi:hypothetical protein